MVQGKPIFGGVTNGNLAYNPDGSYAGVGGANGIPVHPVNRRVSDVEVIRVDITGPEAFGDPASGKDLFAVVASIATNARNGTPQASDLDDLDAVIKQMSTAAADIGTRSARIDDAASINSSQALNLQAKLSDTEEVDLPKTIMELQMQQTGYQAALSVTAKSLQPTLVDFLT